jgi:transposase
MFAIGPASQIYLATGVTDLRKGVNGLYAQIRYGLGRNPMATGEAFGFCNRRRDTVKIFFADRDGMWVCAKRLDGGRYRWPANGEVVVTMTPTELAMLLSGIDLRGAKRRVRWHNRIINR